MRRREQDMSTEWSRETVTALNELQTGARFGHPYTCPNRGDGRHHDNGHDIGCLVATEHGWVCPDCDYTQDWAHASSVDLPRVSGMPGVLTRAACVDSAAGGADDADGNGSAA